VTAFADRRPSPEEMTIGRDVRRRIVDAIRQLSPKLRDALLLSASGDHAYDEIARLLGTRVGTVKWRVSEARRIVSAHLGRTRD